MKKLKKIFYSAFAVLIGWQERVNANVSNSDHENHELIWVPAYGVASPVYKIPSTWIMFFKILCIPILLVVGISALKKNKKETRENKNLFRNVVIWCECVILVIFANVTVIENLMSDEEFFMLAIYGFLGFNLPFICISLYKNNIKRNDIILFNIIIILFAILLVEITYSSVLFLVPIIWYVLCWGIAYFSYLKIFIQLEKDLEKNKLGAAFIEFVTIVLLEIIAAIILGLVFNIVLANLLEV